MLQMKSIPELQKILCDEIDLLREGKTTASRSNAVATDINTILNSVKLQLQCAKFTGESRKLLPNE